MNSKVIFLNIFCFIVLVSANPHEDISNEKNDECGGKIYVFIIQNYLKIIKIINKLIIIYIYIIKGTRKILFP